MSNKTIYNHVFSENMDSTGTTHRIVVQEMYHSQLQYLMRETKRIRESKWNPEGLTLIGIFKPSMSYESHCITEVKMYKSKRGTYYFEIHKTDKSNLPVIRYRRWLGDIVPTI